MRCEVLIHTLWHKGRRCRVGEVIDLKPKSARADAAAGLVRIQPETPPPSEPETPPETGTDLETGTDPCEASPASEDGSVPVSDPENGRTGTDTSPQGSACISPGFPDAGAPSKKKRK